MEKICYAIMPYGGSEQAAIDRFNTVYQLYMMIPAMEKGFTMTREDIQAQAGSITANIVHHLAEADLVIADLSNSNWNVAYELGIRHSLVKGKTVLLCDEKTDLTFDIRGFNIIRYDGDNPASNMFTIQNSVRKAIDNRLEIPTKADNLVHEVFSFAHDNLIDFLEIDETELARELTQAKTTCTVLQAENDRLREELKKAGQSPDASKLQENIAQKIQDAMSTMPYSGDNVVLRLRQAFAASDPDYNEIQSILQKALTEGYLTAGNFRSMYHLFRSQGQPQLTNLILEVAEQQYPASLDFKSYLADAYSDNYRTHDKAIQYANEVLEVNIIDGKRFSRCKKIDGDQLGACLNAYIGVRRFDIMVDIIPQLIEQIPEQRELLLRNLAAAYRELGDNDAQIETLRTLLKEYPMSDVNHYRVYACLRKLNRDRQAFYHLELASVLDPDDIDYLFALPGVIFDERFCRAQNGAIENLSKKEDCAKAALPFLMQAMLVEPTLRCLQRCKDFILRNGIGRYEEEFVKWVEEGRVPYGIPGLNYEGVDFLMQLVDQLNEDLCSQIYIEEKAPSELVK